MSLIVCISQELRLNEQILPEYISKLEQACNWTIVSNERIFHKSSLNNGGDKSFIVASRIFLKNVTISMPSMIYDCILFYVSLPSNHLHSNLGLVH